MSMIEIDCEACGRRTLVKQGSDRANKKLCGWCYEGKRRRQHEVYQTP